MVDLKDFVHQTIKQICEGVQAAQSDVAAARVGHISWNHSDDSKALRSAGFVETNHGWTQFVDFDVAVTASEEVGGNAKVKIATVIEIGGAAKDVAGSTSRVKFRVPLVLPDAN